MGLRTSTSQGAYPEVAICQLCSPIISLSKTPPFSSLSVQFSHSVMSDSLWSHGLQHDRLPCLSQTLGAYSNSCPLSQWCHSTISSSVVPFSALLQSYPASGSFSNESVLGIRWLKYWSFSFSISPSNEYSGLISFRMDWLDLLAVQGTLKSLLQHHSSQASVLQHSAFFIIQLSHPHMTTGKTMAVTIWAFVGKVMSLLLNMLPRLVITFLPRSKHLLISWLQSPSAQKNKVNHCFPPICHEVMGPDTMIFKPIFLLSSFIFIKRLFSSSLSAIGVVSSAYLGSLMFLSAILIPTCALSSPAFLMMCSVYKLNKQDDNIQPWHTPFPILESVCCSMSSSNCRFLTCIQIS